MDVPPAGDLQDGQVHLAELAVIADLLPEIVPTGMAHPVPVEIDGPPGSLLVRGQDRHVAEELVPVVEAERLPGPGAVAHGPGQVDVQLKGASRVVHPVEVEVRRRHLGDDGLEIGRSGGSGHPLDQAHVGHPVHADVAVRPGLRPAPVETVPSVVDLVGPGVPLAVRVVPPAAVLNHVGVTPAGEVPGPVHVEVSAVVVGGPFQDDRPLPLLGGKVDVGRQLDAVPHGNPDVDPDRHLVLGLGQAILPTGEIHRTGPKSTRMPGVPEEEYWRVRSNLDAVREVDRKLNRSYPEKCPPRAG